MAVGHRAPIATDGLTLETMLTALVERYGWPGLGERIPVRCFLHEPNMRSSLHFLRRTPWAREKVEGLYGFMLRDQRRTSHVAPPVTLPAPDDTGAN